MKFSLSLLSIISLSLLSTSASLAHPEVSSSSEDESMQVIRDTHESGLELLGARSHERKARHVQMGESKRDKPFLSKWGQVTWYGGGQLSNPACGGPTPSKWDAVCAVGHNSGTGSCGQTLHIHWKGKMAPCKIVDYCHSCDFGHIDVSQSVFEKLDSLDTGSLSGNGLHFRLLD